MGFDVGDTIVYPPHGAGRVENKERKAVLGEERVYLTIRILHSDMTLMVPDDGAEEAGLRRVVGDDGLERLTALLEGETTEDGGPFSRRFRQNREKIRTGDVFELGEVVRNLTLRDREKPLSTGERQMLTQAKRILCSEVAFSRGTDEQEATEWVDALLERGEVADTARRRSS